MDWNLLLENAPLAGVLIYMHTIGMKKLEKLTGAFAGLIGELRAMLAEWKAAKPA